jgi:hypothetical protein
MFIDNALSYVMRCTRRGWCIGASMRSDTMMIVGMAILRSDTLKSAGLSFLPLFRCTLSIRPHSLLCAQRYEKL